MGIVPKGGPSGGKTIGELYQQPEKYDFEVVVVMRREHMLLPHRDTVIEADDRLALIVSPEAREPLAKFIKPIPQAQGSGTQEPISSATQTG